MSVVIETTLGDITVDLFLQQRPVTCLNFLKLCKMKYYNFNLFHTIRSGFIAQTGDPTGEGSGGESIFGLLEGPEKRFFSGEKMPKIRHTDTGFLSMVGSGDMMIGSQFFFTLGPDLDSLDGSHCVIGEVTEGQDVLRKLNDVICDETNRPYQDVRITHTVVLEDPYNDPSGFRAPSRSPSPSAERLRGGRIAPDEELDETQGKTAEEIQEIIEEKEAKARATILEIVGDLPDAEIAPPENVLFVCKLNPVTTDEDLEIIFSRFGKIVSCEVIRDKKTGDSLQYAFIEFADKKSCEEAYFKMDNVLIDDRRIHVDFSQSVSKIRWLGKGRGVQHINDDDVRKDNDIDRKKLKRPLSKDKDKNDNREHHPRDRNRHSDSRRHREENNGNDRSRHKRHRDEKDLSSRRERSHSKSRRERSRERSSRNNSKREQHNYVTKKTENIKSDHNKNNSFDAGRVNKEKNHSTSYRSTSDLSPVRTEKINSIRSPSRKHKDRSEKHSHNKVVEKDKYSNDNDNRNSNSSSKRNKDDRDNHTSKPKVVEDNKTQVTENKKTKHDEKHIEPRTPSPAEIRRIKAKQEKEKIKNEQQKKQKENVKKSNTNKKKQKRKPSTSSSDSDSSDTSSTSSDSSSSSDSDRKKRSVKRRKRKHSTSSSSSSSTSSTSSSSSDSSSDTSSSSSDSDHKKKKKTKNASKKIKKK